MARRGPVAQPSQSVWRLIIGGPAPGAWNMALDRAILEIHSRKAVPPTLRLYRWSRPAVTLGAFQSAAAIDPEACRAWGVDVVRRATGGRGVLHDDEVTYAVVAGVRDGIPRGVRASYARLCAGVAAAFGTLGIVAETSVRESGHVRSSACYLHATAADVSVGARKLAGSAQVWKGDSVLQHGSFTRTRDARREAAVFALSADEQARFAVSTATIDALCAPCPDLDEIADAVIAGFAHGLGVRFDLGGVNEEEAELAARLSRDAAVVTAG